MTLSRLLAGPAIGPHADTTTEPRMTAEHPDHAKRIAELERQVAALTRIVDALEAELRTRLPLVGFFDQ